MIMKLYCLRDWLFLNLKEENYTALSAVIGERVFLSVLAKIQMMNEPWSKKPKEDKLETLIHEVGCIKERFFDILSLNESSRVPIGLMRVIRDTF